VNEALLPREPDHGCQEGFCNAMSHVNPRWIAPFGNDVTVTDYESRHSTPGLGRAEQPPQRFMGAKGLFKIERNIPGPTVLVSL
jgi:hypothetical protein